MDIKTQNNVTLSSNIKGYLYKWTNYLKGYQKRWFVLQNGLLSYYRNQSEMAHICRGTINIVNAKINIIDSTSFVISHSSMQTFHLKSPNESEMKRWTVALLATQKKAMDLRKGCDHNDTEIDSNELVNGFILKLNEHLEDIKKSQDVLNRKLDDLQKSIHDLDKDKNSNIIGEMALKLKNVKERATIFRVSAASILTSCGAYTESVTSEIEKWKKIIDSEREQRQRMENMVEDLAKQHRHLEYQISSSVQNQLKLNINPNQETTDSDVSDEDFYDAFESQEGVFNVTLPSPEINLGVTLPSRSSELSFEYESDVEDGISDISDNESEISSSRNHAEFTLGDGATKNFDEVSKKRSLQRLREARVITAKQSKQLKNRQRVITASSNNIHKPINQISLTYNTSNIAKYSSVIPIRSKQSRRTQIPPKPNINMNLWSVVKNCIGKDLSKIPMPVNFSEPISMLQRLAEDFEYSEILDKAASCQSPIQQIAYVAAFTVSSYAATAYRINKPFNPLLGETYELDRTDDYGWRLFAEQVSHHPPSCAVHCESNEWVCWFDFSMSNKFRGKYIQINPIGKCHLFFKRSKYHYVWERIPMTIHNIIVGRVWIDNHGEMDIINLTTEDKCHLSYKPYSMFSNDIPKRVTGAITNKLDNVCCVLNGTWDEKLEAKNVISNTETLKGRTYLETEESSILLWQRYPPPQNFDKYYYFSSFAIILNEMEEDIAPTDSRNRPDQRLMEEGKWDEANKEKARLEEEQRNRRVEIIKPDGTKEYVYEYKPLWFDLVVDTESKSKVYKFNGKYWEMKARKDWSMCYTIFNNNNQEV